MCSKRLPDGTVEYRGQCIVTNPNIRPGKLGRYSVDGTPFTQLATAKQHVDTLARLNLIERDDLV